LSSAPSGSSEQQQIRLDHQRARERTALLLAARRALSAGDTANAESPTKRHRLLRALDALSLRHAAAFEPETDVCRSRSCAERVA
jgi:hypothetical protein